MTAPLSKLAVRSGCLAFITNSPGKAVTRGCIGRLDVSKPIELGNIVCLNNFLGGVDEEWFRLVHVEIEAKAGPALASILPGQVNPDMLQPSNPWTA